MINNINNNFFLYFLLLLIPGIIIIIIVHKKWCNTQTRFFVGDHHLFQHRVEMCFHFHIVS